MKILITGATGLIGRELVKVLLQNNIVVNYLTTSKLKIQNKPNYSGFYWNPSEGKIDEKCIENVDAIVHLAGASIAKRWTKSYKKELHDSRVLSANLLFEVLKSNKNQVTQIISASGTAIYPNSDDVIYDEKSTQIDTGFLSELVVKWEESINQFSELNIKTTKLRTGIVFDKNEGALPKIVQPIKMFVGSAFGTGKQLESWIHIQDIANLYYYIIQNQIEGIVNAVSPNPISNKNLTKLIAKIISRPLFMPNIPQWFMKMILGEMHILLFGNKNIQPKRALEAGFKFKFGEPEKALEQILK